METIKSGVRRGDNFFSYAESTTKRAVEMETDSNVAV